MSGRARPVALALVATVALLTACDHKAAAPPPPPVPSATTEPPAISSDLDDPAGVPDTSGGLLKCRDGSVSHAKHRQGACSHHGGLA